MFLQNGENAWKYVWKIFKNEKHNESCSEKSHSIACLSSIKRDILKYSGGREAVGEKLREREIKWKRDREHLEMKAFIMKILQKSILHYTHLWFHGNKLHFYHVLIWNTTWFSNKMKFEYEYFIMMFDVKYVFMLYDGCLTDSWLYEETAGSHIHSKIVNKIRVENTTICAQVGCVVTRRRVQQHMSQHR